MIALKIFFAYLLAIFGIVNIYRVLNGNEEMSKGKSYYYLIFGIFEIIVSYVFLLIIYYKD